MRSTDPHERPWFEPVQLQKYYERISLPETCRDHNATRYRGEASATSRDQGFITTLIHYHMAAIPLENLAMHYTQYPVRSLDPHDIFKVFVEDGRGRGGDGMQHNIFFGTVLVSLGFDVFPTLAFGVESVILNTKVSRWPAPRDIKWNHLTLIFTLDSNRYLIDVGIANRSTAFPVPLAPGLTLPGITPLETQLFLLSDSEEINRGWNRWMYRIRHNYTAPWIDTYVFTEAECLEGDLDIINTFDMETLESDRNRDMIKCQKLILEEAEVSGSVEIVGKEVRRRIHGNLEILEILVTEEQRINALEKYLNIKLTEAEVAGIKGTKSALRL